MRKHQALAWIGLVALAVLLGGCKDGRSGVITVDSVDPGPIPAATDMPFTLTGTGFSPIGADAFIRFSAVGSTPFAGGTSKTMDVTGTVVDSRTITGTTTAFAVVGNVDAFVTVILPQGARTTSFTPVAEFVGLRVDAAAPLSVDSEGPTSVTITGDGFGQSADLAVVTFRAETGTPFLGGTSATLEARGQVDSLTSISVLTPNAGVGADTAAFVEIDLPPGVPESSATPIITFVAPTLTQADPAAADGQNPVALTLTGTGFGPLTGAVDVTFRAASGTPFLGGTAATLQGTGTIDSATSISVSPPVAGVSADTPVSVDLVLPSGASASSAGTIFTFIAPAVAQVDPSSGDSEIPTALAVIGTGFGPTNSSVTVTFRAATGTPFLGGTAATVQATGTVDSATSISVPAPPLAGVSADTPVLVDALFQGGAAASSTSAVYTFVAPTVVQAAPTLVDANAATAIAVTGTGFGPTTGSVTVTFRAVSGTPFSGGTSATLASTGTIDSATSISVTTPITGVTADTFVDLEFASGASASSPTPVLTFLAPSVASVSPNAAESEIPIPITITGDSFGPVTGTATITFTAASGTPFAGGTLATLQTTGTIDSLTSISVPNMPIAGVGADTPVLVDVTLPFGASSSSTATIFTFRAPTVAQVDPSSGDSEIPIARTITGTGFGPTGGSVVVTFRAPAGTPFLGGTAASLQVAGTIASATSISVPNLPSAGVSADTPVFVDVSFPSGAAASSASAIYTFVAPTVTQAAPTPIDANAATAITVTGTGFGPTAGSVSVTFRAASGTPFAGGTSATVTTTGTIDSATSISATTPIVGVNADTFVEVGFASGGSVSSPTPVLTFLAPSVTLASPDKADSEVPISITITGDGFGPVAGSATVTFRAASGTPFTGGTLATLQTTGTIDSATSIRVANTPIAGVSADTPVFIDVELPSGASGSSTTAIFTFVAPTVAQASPDTAESEIPIPITITGAGFGPDAATVTVTFRAASGTPLVGGTQATVQANGTVASATTITVDAPLAGVDVDTPVFVDVEFPSGASASSTTTIFTFLGLTVTQVDPASVDSEVATPMTITGSGFAPDAGTATVTFTATSGTPFSGGTAATIQTTGTIDSATSISVPGSPVAGVSADAAAAVTITLPGGTSGSSTATLVTFLAPAVVSVAPAVVDSAVQTLITITGTGFGPNTASVTVTFQAATGTPFLSGTASSVSVVGTVINATTITATTPITGLANKLSPEVIVAFPSGAEVSNATGLFTFEVAPVAVDDTYTTTGNVIVTKAAAEGLVAPNDSDPDGDSISVSSFDATSTQSGDVTVAANGSFTYNPAPGFTGTDTFTYTITDGFLTDTATVTVTVSEMIWFVDTNATAAGDGRFTDPFDTLAAFNASALPQAGDTIFLHSSAKSYDGNLVLKDGQELLGQGVELFKGGAVIAPAGTAPTLEASSGDALTLGADCTVRGLAITNTNGRGLVGSNGGSVTIDTASVSATGGGAVDLSTSTLDVTFSSVTSTNSAAGGISLATCSGTFTCSSGALNVVNPAGTGIALDSPQGLTVTLGEVTISTPGGDGVFINAGSGTCSFNGACTITTPGTVAGDHGVDIDDSAVNVTFADLNVSDSFGHGVELLNNTGSFTADGGEILRAADVGLHATTCTGSIGLTNLTVMDSGNGAALDQAGHGVLLDDCTGAVTIDGCSFVDMAENSPGRGDDNNGIQVDNRDGTTMPELTILDCEFTGTEVGALGTTTDHGIRIVLDEGSDLTEVTIDGCTAANLGRSFLQILVDVDDDGDDCVLTDLLVANNGTVDTAGAPLPALEAQGDVIEMRVNGVGGVTGYLIDNNTMADGGTGLTSGRGILINHGQFNLGADSTATATGIISNNTLTDLGDGNFDRGIELLVQDSARCIATIDGNTVDGQADEGIAVHCFDTSTSNVTVSNNLLGLKADNDAAGGALDGVLVTTSQTADLCLDLTGNENEQGYVLIRNGGTFGLLLIGTGPHDADAVNAFIEGQNTGTSAASGADFADCPVIVTP